MAAGNAAYKILVALGLVNQTGSGARAVSNTMRGLQMDVDRVQQHLARFGKQWLNPTTIMQARQNMAALNREMARVKQYASTATKPIDQLRLKENLQALGVVKAQLAAQMQGLTIEQTKAKLQDESDKKKRKELETQLKTQQKIHDDAERAARREEQRAARVQRIQATQISQLGSGAMNVGATTGLAGIGILAGLWGVTNMGAKYQQTALQTYLALKMGAPPETMAQRNAAISQLMAASETAAQATGFLSEQDIMEGLRTVATSGGSYIVKKYGMAEFLKATPSLAKFADVMMALRGMPTDESMTLAVQAAHMMQQYKAVGIEDTLEAMSALALIMPDNMSKAVNSLSQFVPIGRIAGASPASLMALEAVMSQMGLGEGRVGARTMSAIVRAAAMAPSPEARRLGLMDAQGRNLVMPGGNLDLVALTSALQHAYASTTNKGQYIKDITKVFNMAGAKVLGLLANPQSLDLLTTDIKTIFGATGSHANEYIQDLLKGTPYGAQKSAAAQLQNTLIDFGMTGLPTMQDVFSRIDRVLKMVDSWQKANPAKAKAIFDAIAGIGGALLAISGISYTVGAIANLKTGVEFIGSLFAEDGALAGLLPWLGGLAAAAAPLLPVIAVIAALVGAFELLTHLPNVVAFLKKWWSENYGSILHTVGFVFGYLAGAIVKGLESLLNIVKAAISQELAFAGFLMADLKANPWKIAMPGMLLSDWANSQSGGIKMPSWTQMIGAAGSGAAEGWGKWFPAGPQLNNHGTIIIQANNPMQLYRALNLNGRQALSTSRSIASPPRVPVAGDPFAWHGISSGGG